MVIQVNNNYTLEYNGSWSQLQLNEIYVWCDTTLSPITITLPLISSMNGQLNAKIYIVDVKGTASANNITINAFSGNTIGGGSAVITSNGGSLLVTAVDEVNWLLIGGGSGSGVVDYKQSRLPSVSINPQSVPRPDLYGDSVDFVEGFGIPYIRLNSGNLASVNYCQCILTNGILIYECYDVEGGIFDSNGYWVAFKQNASNPKLLEKVAELKMTSQFWDNWYNWTLKNEGDNVVNFVNTNKPYEDSVIIQSWITKLTYNEGVLTAEDSVVNFGGETVLSLYNSLSGYGILSGSWNYALAEYILDDDYYGMANGKEVGWCYYRNQTPIFDPYEGEVWNCVGFNVITGETRWIKPVSIINSTVTNFNFSDVITTNMIQNWVNHPNGISFSFSDAQPLNNGNNNNSVTCFWSPYFENPNNVIYINTRDDFSGQFQYIYGNFIGLIGDFYGSSLYWDNVNFYVHIISPNNLSSLIIQRFNTNTKEIKTWHIPLFMLSRPIIYANNEGTSMLSDTYFTPNYGTFTNIYAPSTNADYFQLQSNSYYATNMIGNKCYSANNSLQNNIYNVGLEVDEYVGIDFSNN